MLHRLVLILGFVVVLAMMAFNVPHPAVSHTATQYCADIYGDQSVTVCTPDV